MKKIGILIFLLGISCTEKSGEVVQTAYIDPLTLPPILKYNFSRNGSSSVDVLECSLVKEPLDVLYNSFFKQARINYQSRYEEALNLYRKGIYYIEPEQYTASSPLHFSNKEKIVQDIFSIFESVTKIGGLNTDDPFLIRGREAQMGKTGYIGFNVGDPNVAFVDAQGIAPAERYNGMILGAIYLDRILNYHLDEHWFDNAQLRKKHEDVVLLTGRNYTELEHHWDLAYGYYAFFKNLVQPDGISILKDSERKLFNAFVQGRIELERYRYSDMYKHIRIIRQELSKVIAIQAMNAFIGVNTLVNLEENNGSDAFVFISQGCGLLYALQFTRNENEPYFSYEKVTELYNSLIQNKGLWDKERLLSDENTPGSLHNVAQQIGKPFGILITDIKK